MINKSDKIYIAGHRGMVGSACWRALEAEGYTNLIGKTSKEELDLRDQKAVEDFIRTEKPVAIIDAAANVGGIHANNSFPYEFLMDNLLIQNNLIHSAHINDVERFIFLGSSCIYPKMCDQPIKEEYLLTGSLEQTNQWYATAKITGVKLIEALRIEYDRDYVSLMPTNLYGPFDNFDLKHSHVMPALIRKIIDAKVSEDNEITLWGNGEPLREFLYVDDLANAVVFIMKNKTSKALYNVGSGKEITIKNLAHLIMQLLDVKLSIKWDDKMPNGTPRKILDSSLIESLGWKATTNLETGILNTVDWLISNEQIIKEKQIKKYQ